MEFEDSAAVTFKTVLKELYEKCQPWNKDHK